MSMVALMALGRRQTPNQSSQQPIRWNSRWWIFVPNYLWPMRSLRLTRCATSSHLKLIWAKVIELFAASVDSNLLCQFAYRCCEHLRDRNHQLLWASMSCYCLCLSATSRSLNAACRESPSSFPCSCAIWRFSSAAYIWCSVVAVAAAVATSIQLTLSSIGASHPSSSILDCRWWSCRWTSLGLNWRWHCFRYHHYCSTIVCRIAVSMRLMWMEWLLLMLTPTYRCRFFAEMMMAQNRSPFRVTMMDRLIQLRASLVYMAVWFSHYLLFSAQTNTIIIRLLSICMRKARERHNYQFAVMMLTVAAVFDIVQIVAGLLAEQTQSLSACHVKLLLTSWFIALHARANIRLIRFAHLLANVANFPSRKKCGMKRIKIDVDGMRKSKFYRLPLENRSGGICNMIGSIVVTFPKRTSGM